MEGCATPTCEPTGAAPIREVAATARNAGRGTLREWLDTVLGEENGKTLMESSLKIDSDVVDAGKRAADALNLHLMFGDPFRLRTQWMAVNLSDGRSDGVLYDSRRDAVKHQYHEQQCCYVSFANLSPGAVNAKEMSVFIQFNRDAYKAGMRMVDPDHANGGIDPLLTTGHKDYYMGRASRDKRN